MGSSPVSFERTLSLKRKHHPVIRLGAFVSVEVKGERSIEGSVAALGGDLDVVYSGLLFLPNRLWISVPSFPLCRNAQHARSVDISSTAYDRSCRRRERGVCKTSIKRIAEELGTTHNLFALRPVKIQMYQSETNTKIRRERWLCLPWLNKAN